MSSTKQQPIVVTIGRQFGSGGRELGRKLSKRLGFKYYDKELLSEAARQAGVDEYFFKLNDERFPSFLNGIFSFAFGLNNVNCYTGSTSISDDSLYRAQSDFIHSLADKENCVIVGRTSDYVLRDHERLVNLFVHAPMESCVKRIMGRAEEQPPRSTNYALIIIISTLIKPGERRKATTFRLTRHFFPWMKSLRLWWTISADVFPISSALHLQLILIINK